MYVRLQLRIKIHAIFKNIKKHNEKKKIEYYSLTNFR